MARTPWLAGLAAAVLLTLSGCGSNSHSKAGAAKRVEHPAILRLVGPGGSDPIGVWVQAVESLSHGKVRIRPGHSPAPTVDMERRLVADVRSGRRQIAYVGARAFDLFGNHAFQALAAPTLVDSYALEEKVLASPLAGQMLTSIKPLGVVGIAILPGPLRRMLGVRRSFATPGDFRGAVVGYVKSALSTDALHALGASPRPTPPGGPLAGLDGLEQQLGLIAANGYMEQARSITVAPALWPRPYVVIMNPRVYARLSPNQREVLRTALSHVSPGYVDALRQSEESAARQLCRAHARFIEADAAQFRAAFAPVYAQLDRDPRTASYIAQIEKLKSGIAPEATPRCGAQHTAVTRRAAPIDGVWRTTRAPEPHVQPENYGTIIRVFDRGRYAKQQWSRRACTWAYGTYTLHGNAIRLVNVKAGGIAPTNTNAKPGETIPLLWNVYRGKLSLPNAPEVHDSPIEATAYTLVDKTPSSKYFIKRCPPPADWNR
jgi:TRAP-type C4-dicarboxylate transport system substrate-binding protein